MDKKETLVKKLKNELHESDSYISELQLKIKNEAEKSEELRKELNYKNHCQHHQSQCLQLTC